MAGLRRAGLLAFSIDGERYDVVGNINYSLGEPVREELIGADGVHGYKEVPGTPLMELEIRDSGDLDVASVARINDATVTAELVNGKAVVLRRAFQASPVTQGSEEGTVEVRFVGLSAEEISTV